MQKTTFISALAAFVSQAYAEKCYAVAFSAGAQESAYQVGALKALVENYSAGETAYSAVTGVSGGAVNAAILASFPAGQETAAVSRMQTFWENSSAQRLWKDWPAGLIEGLMFKGGLYNNKPLLNFLATEMADIAPSQRFIDIGLTNILTGMYTDFQAGDLTGQELVDVMLGSFDYAGFFAPEAGLGSNWTDGSTIMDLDIFPAVNACLAQGHAYEDIVVDVVMTSSKTLKQVDASNYGAMHMMYRFLQVARYYNAMDGLLRAQFAYPTVQFRHIIAPSGDLP